MKPPTWVVEEGQVLAGQLILQRLGRRGHHDPDAGDHGRDQVGERLAGAGPGLDDQVAAGLDGVGHGLGHGPLAVAHLAAAGELGHDLLQGLGDLGGGHRATVPRPR